MQAGEGVTATSLLYLGSSFFWASWFAIKASIPASDCLTAFFEVSTLGSPESARWTQSAK